MAVTVRRKAQDEVQPGELEQLRADLAGTRAALQLVARVTAQAAANTGRGEWTDFAKLLREQFSLSPADADLFLSIVTGREP